MPLKIFIVCLLYLVHLTEAIPRDERRKAWWSLLHNSKRLTPQFAKTQRYEKYGDFDVALKQFLTLNPTNVRVKESAEGVVMSVSGRVGDRLFSVKTTTREQTGEAIITARVDNANYKHPKLLGKITYMGKKEIKSNLWWRSD